MDYLKKLFNFNAKHDYGPTGLPIGVEEELFSQYNKKNSSDKRQDKNTMFHFNYHDHSTTDQFDGFVKEFESMLQHIFGETHDLPISYPDSEAHEDKIQQDDFNKMPESEKSLRDKMFERGDDKDSLSEVEKYTVNGKCKTCNDLFSFNEKRTNDPFDSFFFTFRSPFFKFPTDDQHIVQEDNDLDHKVQHGEFSIDDILRNDDQRQPRPTELHPFFSFPPFTSKDFIMENSEPDVSSAFKYSTVTKKINSDGSIETIKRRKDSDGNEEETTSRSMGEQTHSVTTKRSIEGKEEHSENFINMTEDDLKNFEEKWKEKKTEDVRNSILKPSEDNSSWWWKPKL